MRIGLINQIHGHPGGEEPTPSWETIKARATAAEEAGFDLFVFEDALLYRWENGTTDGVWESVSMCAALMASTSRMDIGHSVLNAPYRSPAMTAKIADTLDEVSGGRYVFGIGAGNTFDSDYEAFGFPTDKRFSRFAESIQIIHGLLKRGRVDFEGEYYSARNAELVLRGPRPQGPPINVAAGGPKMLQLVAEYADAWNWWAWDEAHDQTVERMTPLIEALDRACEAAGRDPGTLERTFDVYTVVPEGFEADGPNLSQPLAGTSDEIAARILALGELGFSEIRCDVHPRSTEAIAALAPVVAAVHAA